ATFVKWRKTVAVENRTEGIEISQLYLHEIRFLFWDFAGQEEYYLTHHVFITPRALVILTVDLASYSIADPRSFKDQLWFWINNIQLRVPDSVVLLVGTHCDQCRDQDEVMEKKKDIEEKVKTMLANRRTVLKQQKKNLEDNMDPSLFLDQMDELDCLLEHKLKVLDLVTINCTRTEDIMKLKSHILACIESESMFLCSESILPKSYEAVEQAIPTLLANKEIPQHAFYLANSGVIRESDYRALSATLFIHTIVRQDLVQLLEGLTRDLLMQEGVLVKQNFTWVNDLRCRGTLHNAAIRILIRRELEKLVVDDDDLVTEVVGTKREEGIVLTLLHYFEVCLPTLVRSHLNPQAPEFIPGKKQWESSEEARRDPDGACVFPIYLEDNLIVCHKWGEDKQDDLRVHVYFLPEIPHSFFHRVIIKTCSLYPTHWVGRDQCLLCCGNRLALLRQNNNDGDSFIEIRCRRPEKDREFRQTWDLILAVMSKLFVLSKQWPGLTQQVHTPCPERGCPHYFTWRDWQELNNTDFYNLIKSRIFSKSPTPTLFSHVWFIWGCTVQLSCRFFPPSSNAAVLQVSLPSGRTAERPTGRSGTGGGGGMAERDKRKGSPPPGRNIQVNSPASFRVSHGKQVLGDDGQTKSGSQAHHEQKNIKDRCYVCPDWQVTRGPTLEPGLGLGLAGERLVAGSLPTGPGRAQPRNGDVGPPSSRLTTRRKVHEGPVQCVRSCGHARSLVPVVAWQPPNPVVDTGSKGCRQVEEAEEGVLSRTMLACGTPDAQLIDRYNGRPSSAKQAAARTVLEAKTRVWEEFQVRPWRRTIMVGLEEILANRPAPQKKGEAVLCQHCLQCRWGAVVDLDWGHCRRRWMEKYFEDLLNPTDLLASNEEAEAGVSEVDSSITQAAKSLRVYGSLPNQSVTCALWIWRRHSTVSLVVFCGECSASMGSRAFAKGCSVSVRPEQELGWGRRESRFGNHRISSLLFADDVVLMASSGQDLQHVLERFAAECEAAGMRISTSKSEAMVLDRKRVAVPSPAGGRNEFPPCRVAGRSLRDRVRSSVTREELGVEPLLLRIERSQLRWLGHLFPAGCPLDASLGRCSRHVPPGGGLRGRPRTRWRNYVSRLAWERLRGPPGRAGGSVWGEGSLGISAQTAASATRSRTKRMKKMKMKIKISNIIALIKLMAEIWEHGAVLDLQQGKGPERSKDQTGCKHTTRFSSSALNNSPPLSLSPPEERQQQRSESDAFPIDPDELHPSSPSSVSLPARSSLSPTLPPSLSNPLAPSPPLLSAVDALLTYSMDSGGEGEEGWMEDQWEKWLTHDISLDAFEDDDLSEITEITDECGMSLNCNGPDIKGHVRRGTNSVSGRAELGAVGQLQAEMLHLELIDGADGYRGDKESSKASAIAPPPVTGQGPRSTCELTPPREHSCLSDEDKVQGGGAQTKDRGTSTDAPCRHSHTSGHSHCSSTAAATRSKLQEKPPAPPPPPQNYTPAPLYPAGKADGGDHHRERIRYHTDVHLEPTEEIYLTPVQRSADPLEPPNAQSDRPFLSQQTEQGRMSISSDTEGPPPYQPLPDRTNPSIYEEDEVYVPPPSYASCVESLITPPSTALSAQSSLTLDLSLKGAGTGAGVMLRGGSSVEYVDATDDSYCGEDEDVDRIIMDGRMGKRGGKGGSSGSKVPPRTSMSSEASGLSYDSVKYTLVVDEHAQLELSARGDREEYEEEDEDEEEAARIGGVRREATACLSEDSTPEVDLHFSKKFLNVFMNGRSRSSSAESFGLYSCVINGEERDQSHRAVYRFVPRHDDELELEVDDPLLVEVQSEDYWYEGYNMRTGAHGIFPAYYAIEVTKDPESYKVKSSEWMDRYRLKFLGSVQVPFHKGNDVLCAAMQKIATNRRMTVKYNPPSSCILEISVKGIKLSVQEDYYATDRSNECNHFFQLKNVSFCGYHPKNSKYFGFITKHPADHRFACHVFVSENSTKPLAESVG
ncbi:hypothetical protein L3Q82_008570, partial [Scortum barcoo]